MHDTQTEIRPLCTLRTAFDLVFNGVSEHNYNAERSVQKIMLEISGHISGPKGPPDMIASAFDMKPHQ